MSERTAIDEAWTRIPPDKIAAAGHEGVIGYFSRDASKDLTRSYINSCHGNGLWVAQVFETTETESERGYDAGVADANWSIKEAIGIGYPHGVVIFLATDTDASYAQVRDYYRGARDTLHPASFLCGAYGGVHITEPLTQDGVIDHAAAWQTQAWSGSNIGHSAVLYQRVTPTRPIAGYSSNDFDEDVVLGEFARWGPGGLEGVQQPKPGGPVKNGSLIQIDGSPKVYECIGGFKVWIPTKNLFNLLGLKNEDIVVVPATDDRAKLPELTR